ncbi:MAG: PKD domain-containing protein [Cyclobacteriaceae bacterium]
MKSTLTTLALLWIIVPAMAQEVSFALSTDSGCAPLDVTFTNTSTDPNIGHIEWNMGDGTKITDEDVVNYTYVDADFYFVTMSAFTAGWELIDFYDAAIEVDGIELIGAAPEVACPGEDILFYASEGATSYSWNFGDGTTGSGFEVTKTYNQTGTYNVTLIASFDACGEQTKSIDVTVAVGEGPEVDMQFDDEGVCPGEAISFLTLTEGASYLWDFGDGTTSDQMTPDHAYAEAGEYTVSLSVSNTCGGVGTATSTLSLSNVGSWPDDLQAVVDNPIVCPNQEVIFSADEGDFSYQFDFGDGQNVTQAESAQAAHTYQQEGDYYAEVRFTNSCQADTSISILVIVTTEYSFLDDLIVEAEKDSICPASYNAYTAPAGYAWYVWDYGDGSDKDSLSVNEALHFYENEGTFETKLKIYSACGADTVITSDLLVSVTAEPIDGGVDFSHPASACPHGDVDFYISNEFESYTWDFGDGTSAVQTAANDIQHVFDAAGEYTVKLTVANSCGNTREVTSTIVIDDNQQLPSDLELSADKDATCPGSQITLFAPSGYASYVWILDGTRIDSTSNSSISSQAQNIGASSYEVKIYNSCGNSATASKEIVISDDLPFTERVNLSGSSSACPGQNVVLFATDGFQSYDWSFGDNTTLSGDAAISHAFAEEGTYEVAVKVTNACGSDSTIIKTVEVRADAPFTEFVSLSSDKPVTCPGEIVGFNTSFGFDRYVWAFGVDNQTVETSISEVNFTYPDAGIFDVSVTLFNTCGNDTTLILTHEVSAQSGFPDDLEVLAAPQSVCPGEEIAFTAPVGYQNYQWDFGDENILEGNQQSAKHAFDEVGEYPVSVTFENLCGESHTLDYVMTIQSNAPFSTDLALSADTDENCPGDAFIFTAPSGYSGYEWDFGVDSDPALYQFKEEVSFAYANTGTYVVNVTFQNTCGNSKTISKTVSVGQDIAQIEGLFLEFIDGVCPGEEMIFQSKSGFGKYVWTFSDGLKDTTETSSFSHSFDDLGVYDVAVTVFNACGASQSITDKVNVTDEIEFVEEFDLVAKDNVCPGELFILQGPDGFNRYSWTVDGFTATTSDPVYEYELNDLGTYEVALSVFNSCGSDSTFTSNITIGSDGGFFDAFASLSASAYEMCPGDEVSFVLQAEGVDSYLWTIADGEPFVSGEEVFATFDVAGEYAVGVTATNYCGQDTTISVTVLATTEAKSDSRVFEVAYSDDQFCPSEPIEIFATRGFSSYQWSFGDGQTITTEEEIVNHAFVQEGNYAVSVNAYDNCQNEYSSSVIIAVSNNENFDGDLGLEISSSEVCLNEEVSLSVIGARDSYNYLWTIADSTFSTASGQISYAVAQSGPQPVSVRVTNVCGAEVTLDDVITGSATAPISDIEFGVDGEEDRAGCPGDAITFFFEGEYENMWNFGDGTSMTASEQGTGPDGTKRTVVRYAYAEAGTYDVTLTLTNDCGASSTVSTSVSVGGNLANQISISLGGKDPEVGYARCAPVSFTVNSGASFAWSFGDGTQQTTSNPVVEHIFDNGGDYQVFVDVTNGCGIVQRENISVKIANQSVPVLDEVEITHINCEGDDSGSIDVTAVSGFEPFTYEWGFVSDQINSNSIDGLFAGIYELTVTDRFGCSTATLLEIEEEQAVSLDPTITNASCGESTGSISLGLANPETYAYLWNDSNTASERTGLSAGQYSVTVTSQSGCVVEEEFSVSETDAPQITAAIDHIVCAGEASGQVVLTIEGGHESILWSTGSTSNFIQNKPAGVYTVEVTGSNGCVSTASYALTEPKAIEVDVVKSGETCGGNLGSAKIIASGGTGTLSYAWSNGLKSSASDKLFSGSYTVTVSDENGCEKQVNFEIEEIVNLTLNSTVTDISCPGEIDGAIAIAASNGLIPYTYQWSTGDSTALVSGLQSGTYNVLVTDAIGCSVNQYFTIAPAAELADIDLGADTELCPDETLSLEISAAYDSVVWSTGSHDYAITISKGGFSQTDLEIWAVGFTKNGCSKSDTINVHLSECQLELAVKPLKASVFPNPTVGWAQVQFGYEAIRTISVYSIEGKLVLPQVETENVYQDINLESLENGLYMINVKEGQRNQVFRVIKR